MKKILILMIAVMSFALMISCGGGKKIWGI